MKKPPCKGCDRRTTEPNCHTECPISKESGYGYPEYAKERSAYLERKRFADKTRFYYVETTIKRKERRR